MRLRSASRFDVENGKPFFNIFPFIAFDSNKGKSVSSSIAYLTESIKYNVPGFTS